MSRRGVPLPSPAVGARPLPATPEQGRLAGPAGA
jgi:hypothetical protein